MKGISNSPFLLHSEGHKWTGVRNSSICSHGSMGFKHCTAASTLRGAVSLWLPLPVFSRIIMYLDALRVCVRIYHLLPPKLLAECFSNEHNYSHFCVCQCSYDDSLEFQTKTLDLYVLWITISYHHSKLGFAKEAVAATLNEVAPSKKYSLRHLQLLLFKSFNKSGLRFILQNTQFVWNLKDSTCPMGFVLANCVAMVTQSATPCNTVALQKNHFDVQLKILSGWTCSRFKIQTCL